MQRRQESLESKVIRMHATPSGCDDRGGTATGRDGAPGESSVRHIPSWLPRLLVVDVEVLIGRTLQRLLRHDFEVACVASVAQAEALVDADPDAYDVMLCDVVMPGRTGPDLHAWLRRHHPRLAHRLVFMSGSISLSLTEGALGDTGRPCVDKPFTRNDLVDALGACIKPA